MSTKSPSENRRGLSRFCAGSGAKRDCPPLRGGSRIGSTLDRRHWLGQMGAGFGSLALAALLGEPSAADDPATAAAAPQKAHFPPGPGA